MSAPRARPAGEEPVRGPGRPASDAPQRILDAAYEVLRREGYIGLTTAKVAAASGQNKALISYYYGSKRGLVSAVAQRVSEQLVEHLLAELGEPADVRELVEHLSAGVWNVMDVDEGLQRVFFDLSSQAVVESEVHEILGEMKSTYRAILRELLRGMPDGPAEPDLDAFAIYLIAGLEGLALERLERGETPALVRARELFVQTAPLAIGSN